MEQAVQSDMVLVSQNNPEPDLDSWPELRGFLLDRLPNQD